MKEVNSLFVIYKAEWKVMIEERPQNKMEWIGSEMKE